MRIEPVWGIEELVAWVAEQIFVSLFSVEQIQSISSTSLAKVYAYDTASSCPIKEHVTIGKSIKNVGST